MTSDGISTNRGALPALTGLRAVAALFVFGFHTSSYGPTAFPVWHVFDIGFVGVAFFFVLSGVVLTWSARPGQLAGDFWFRRAARIYPSFLVATLAAIGIYVWLGGQHGPWWSLPFVFVLLHAWAPTQEVQSAADGVSWSLSCEAFFYLLFPGIMPWLARHEPRRRHR